MTNSFTYAVIANNAVNPAASDISSIVEAERIARKVSKELNTTVSLYAVSDNCYDHIDSYNETDGWF